MANVISVWLIALGIVFGGAVLCVLNFRFLLYELFPRLNPVATARQLPLDGPTLFISDLHLKADRKFPYSKSLSRVMESRHVRNLVIDGDLFDSHADARMILDRNGLIADILGLDELGIRVFFVQGSPPHDPPPQKDLFKGTPIEPLGNCAILDFNNLRVVAYHGQDLSSKGAFGHGWDRFISSLSLERAWKRAAGVPEGDWVIFGHTHTPGIDAKGRVANCGGWKSQRYLVRPACTGIVLSPDSGSLEMVKFA